MTEEKQPNRGSSKQNQTPAHDQDSDPPRTAKRP